MSFKKCSSIENSYRNKYILKWLGAYPELSDCEYVIREKLVGVKAAALVKDRL